MTVGSGTYVLVPRAMFFEFIPIEIGDSGILFADQVEVGKSYEVIITTVSGLYRYRLGDVVKVVGFFNNTPLLEFLYRQVMLQSVFIILQFLFITFLENRVNYSMFVAKKLLKLLSMKLLTQ